MEPLDKKILIVGSGLAGLTLAVIFKKSGINVDLIETSNHLEPDPMGMLLYPQSLTILRELGLNQEVESGYRIQKGLLTNEKGKVLGELNLNSTRGKYGDIISLFKSTLHQSLLGYLDKESVQLNTEVDTINNHRHGAEVTFSNGLSKEYALVIGADGIHSSMRERVFPQAKVKASSHKAFRFVLEGVSLDNHSVTEMWGSGKRFCYAPMGGERVYCYGMFDKTCCDYASGLPRNEYLQSIFSELRGQGGEMISQLSDKNKIILSQIKNVYLDKWFKKRVVLIGDAAHGISPNLGLGGALAMEDAARLSQQLIFSNQLKQGLKSFEKAQKRRVRSIRSFTAGIGWLGQLTGTSSQVRDKLLKWTPDAVLLKLIQPAFYNNESLYK